VIIAGLRSSSFVGGPERQMIGLAQTLSPPYQFQFLLFSEGGRCQPVLNRVREAGLTGIELSRNVPHFPAMIQDVAVQLRRMSANLLCCYGYKADLVGLMAARRVGIPVVAVAQGWTTATAKVRFYELLDRLCLRGMDQVVCVSEAQAEKVRRAGMRPDRLTVIRDAVRVERFDHADPSDRVKLAAMFPHRPDRIVGSAGRLSPEKGFGVLVEAAAIVTRSDPGVGFVHFGDGPLRKPLEQRIAALGLEGRFILAGFRDDLDRFLPHWDLSALPSFTEGMPNVVLESYAAGVPVVATAVGGTPEAVADGVDGFLVPPGDPAALARCILDVLNLGDARKTMGRCGQERIRAQFTFEAQALRYRELLEDLRTRRLAATSVSRSGANSRPTSWR
jgi:glycosyltransferase involved in cell wall biosynthesis